MRWKDGKRSSNVDDRRGKGGRNLAVGGGLGTIIIVIIAIIMGENPLALLNSGQLNNQQKQQSVNTSPEEDEIADFSTVVLGYTEETWAAVFAENGLDYKEPRMVLFTAETQTACGVGAASMGPFYCPADQTIYMDLSFFKELKDKFGAKGGDFAIAYVIAHEVGHHIQTLLGTTQKVHQMRTSGQYSKEEVNRLSVAVELQADFFAGVWAKRTEEKYKVLEEGDIEEAMSAAAAVGDDAIQKRMRGYVTPESFTHGSSEQRMKWFNKGFQTGDMNAGNTFEALLQ
ncbi:MAG: neutral zinc metallopeptidase [Thermonemataceae bacterium]